MGAEKGWKSYGFPSFSTAAGKAKWSHATMHMHFVELELAEKFARISPIIDVLKLQS